MSEEEITLQVLKALASENRLKLLYALQDGEKTVSQLLPILPTLQPTVSTHLIMMEKAGLLKVRDAGRMRYYSVRYPKIFEILGDINFTFFVKRHNEGDFK